MQETSRGDYNAEKPGVVITEEQRARISQNYRAAKALLARKRPPLSSPFIPHKIRNTVQIHTQSPVTCTKRAILSNKVSFDPQTPVTNPIKAHISNASPFGSRSCVTTSERTPLGEIKVNLVESFGCESVEKDCRGKRVSYNEPGSACSVLSGCAVVPSILDDDEFDDKILEEIDAICEERSAVKAKKSGSECDRSLLLNDCNVTVSDSVAVDEGKLILGDGEAFGTEENDDTEMVGCENMPKEYLKYLKNLNERQCEAACSDISIPLMIVAGPGSGKTSTMVGRILKLLNEGIGPSNILAMTFTTAAASEMRDRIGAVAGKGIAKEITISTFHSFSLQLCRSHAEKLDRTSEFLIYGNGHQRRAVIEAVRLLDKENSEKHNDVSKPAENSDGIKPPDQFKDMSKKWQKFVTQAKASGKTPADYQNTGDETRAAILRNYNDILRSCNALDYHDLISCSVKLLTDFPEVFQECQELWKAVVIDEFQDTSAMQYRLLRLLASHNRITVVGDDDQSIFSFNGADISGFDSFRHNFPNYKEIRLNKNYRSTRYIVEAASYLIQNNMKRSQSKDILTDNSSGSKITIKECQNESAQCTYVVDKILETACDGSSNKPTYGSIAILYRRQVSGKLFQSAFRDRKIPFNVHGVAFYRKKVVKVIIAMLRTALPGCDDGPYRQVFKAMLPLEKEDKMKMIDHVEKISTIRKCNFISSAYDIFSAKISGTFKRSQLTHGRKVLSTIEMISKLIHREQSLSSVVTSVANLIPQRYLLEQRAVVDVDGGKLLNEDNDIRSVLQYLLDDVTDFLSTHFTGKEGKDDSQEEKGCVNMLKAFIDYITEREKENFRSRRHDNDNSVTLTTIHQSKGLEWDAVFIVKANDSEIPLLHEFNGVAKENATSIEEERRLLYVAMTRARKKLYILYVTMDSNWQMLQPSRFLKEIPNHLREVQADICVQELEAKHNEMSSATAPSEENKPSKVVMEEADNLSIQNNEALKDSTEALVEYHGDGNIFLKRFTIEDRVIVSHLFHKWAKMQAFQNSKRLIDKIGFVIDERLRVKKNKHKDVLNALKSCLRSDEAFQYAEHVLRWEKIPADQRAQLMREKQEHFQKLRIENSMSSSAPTSKQIKYLQNLGCTLSPTSRLHASRLIEQYKSL